MTSYDKQSQRAVKKAMPEYKHEGEFKNRQQAIAVGLSKARQKGSQAPAPDN